MLILKELPESSLPELKGVSSATTGSFAIADGLGSAQWSIPSLADLAISPSEVAISTLVVPVDSFSYSAPAAAFLVPTTPNVYVNVADVATSNNLYLIGSALENLKSRSESNEYNITLIKNALESIRQVLVDNALITEEV